jgi:hypothetical protein
VPRSLHQDSPCLGCDVAFLIQHLVRTLQWTSARLPVDGLKSAIFLSPSPTLCLASGTYTVAAQFLRRVANGVIVKW